MEIKIDLTNKTSTESWLKLTSNTPITVKANINYFIYLAYDKQQNSYYLKAVEWKEKQAFVSQSGSISWWLWNKDTYYWWSPCFPEAWEFFFTIIKNRIGDFKQEKTLEENNKFCECTPIKYKSRNRKKSLNEYLNEYLNGIKNINYKIICITNE